MLKPGDLYFPEDDVCYQAECNRKPLPEHPFAKPTIECIVPNANLFVVVPSNNGNCLVRYPFEYGDVVCVQN